MSVLPGYLRYQIKVTFTILLISMFERITILMIHWNLLLDNKWNWSFKSMAQGFKFDFYVASLVALLPVLLMGITYLFFKKDSRKLTSFFMYFNAIFLIIAASIIVSDLPYFEYYNTRLTTGVFSWVDDLGTMFSGLLSDTSLTLYTALGILIAAALIWLNIRFLRTTDFKNTSSDSLRKRSVIFALSIFILLVGVRGTLRVEGKPLNSEMSIISDHTFVNQSVVNPIFSFFDSYRTSEAILMNEEEAMLNAANYLGRKGTCRPLQKKIDGSEKPTKNIVLILVESLSTHKVGIAGGEKGLTKNLDSLAENGLFFSNFYSNGTHTHNGIFSSLYSFSSIYDQKILADNELSTLSFKGMPVTLKEKGYRTKFFYTGDLKFDNMASFLKDHGFDELHGIDDYKKEDIYNAWGLSDHKLYEYMLESMDESYLKGEPFFISALTVSTHHGYDAPIPEGFHPNQKKKSVGLRYEYADWAIGNFISEVNKREYADNTMFIIVGDHGQNFNPVYKLPLSYVQVPLIVFGKSVRQERVENFGIQLDIFPTVMGLTGLSYVNDGFGIDLLKEERPFAYFSSDVVLACIDQEYYWMSDINGKQELFRYKEKSLENHIESNPEKAAEMKKYAFSMMQASQTAMKKKLFEECPD